MPEKPPCNVFACWSAFQSLKLDRLDVVHAGTQSYRLAEGIRAVPATEMNNVLRPLRE